MAVPRRNAPTASLPAELTSFVGRRRELAEVKRLLSSSRLLTLTGPGGVGKTRLAVRAAQDTGRHHPRGTWFVELAPVTDPQLVIQAVFATLGLQDRSSAEAIATLASYLADRQSLLILDNAEHVLEATAVLAGALLRSCSELRILVTSRRALGIAGEVVVAVPPLTLSSSDATDGAWSRSDAVALFAERAAAAHPAFNLDETSGPRVLELCERLGGLPLALELAAVRVRVLGLDALDRGVRARLDALGTGDMSAVPRQRTLEAAIDWSFRLLAPAEQLLWARLSVFAGGFGLDAVTEVCAGDSFDADDVDGLIARLVEQSVVDRPGGGDESRYTMLEPLRQFGRERLRASGTEEAVRIRHLAWVTSLAAAVGARDARQVDLFQRMRAERSNVWAAIELCLADARHADEGVRLLAELWVYWSSQGPINDVRRVLKTLLGVRTVTTRSRALGLGVSAGLALQQNEERLSGPMLAEALELGRRVRDAEVVGDALCFASAQAWVEARPADAVALGEEALALATAMGLESTRIRALANLGYALLGSGRVDEAIARAHEGIGLSIARGEVWDRGILNQLLSAAFLAKGDLDAARTYARTALVLEGSLDDRTGQAHTLEILAAVELARGAPETAAVLHGASEAMLQSVPTQLMEPFREGHETATVRIRSALGQARHEQALGTGGALEGDALLGFAVEGRMPAAAPAASSASPESGHAPLSSREMEVARLVADGATNADVASRLFISERTVESHVSSVMNKLGVDSRVRVARWVATVDEAQRPVA